MDGIRTRLFATHSNILTSMSSTTPYGMASTNIERSPTKHPYGHFHNFGYKLEPPYIIGAKSHSTGKLLRTS